MLEAVLIKELLSMDNNDLNNHLDSLESTYSLTCDPYIEDSIPKLTKAYSDYTDMIAKALEDATIIKRHSKSDKNSKPDAKKSRDAKKRFKKNKSTYLKAHRKFRRSSKGKTMAKKIGRHNSKHSDLNKESIMSKSDLAKFNNDLESDGIEGLIDHVILGADAKDMIRDLSEGSRNDVTALYPELKKLIKRGQGDFNKFIKAFDKMAGDYDRSDPYAIRDAVSDALDASGTSFSYDKLTQLVIKTF